MPFPPTPAGTFTAASSVQLRNLMRVAEAEGTRKSAYEGLRSIGPFVSEAFIGIIKDRNKLAKLLGFEDFYDYKVGLL
jgi:Zn-dependent oligopeptidase